MPVQTPEEAIFLGLTLGDISKFLLSFIITGVVFFIFKKNYDTNHDRFLNGAKLNDDDLKLMENDVQGNKLEGKSPEEQQRLRRDFSLHCELEQIKKTKWSDKYIYSLDKLERGTVRLIDDKIHYPTKSDQLSFLERFFGARVFTVKSYEF